MRRHRWFGVVLLSALTFASCGAEPVPDGARQANAAERAAVVGAWKNYLAAVEAKDGDKAVTLVSRSTVEDYGRICDMALHATREELAAESSMTRLRVLGMRGTYEAKLLQELTSAQLFARSVTDGLATVADLAGSSLGSVSIKDDEAHATYISAKHGRGPEYRFEREGGGWKLDAISIVEAAEPQWDRMVVKAAKNAEVSIDEFLVALVADTVGREIGDEIWQPPVPR